eukprot:TRINITY_DN23891_c0_g2_i1.p1 TRINITY_DN23891_c0_g2~~TRINITY_DN23891_c0_g2_i1.p1  ORF type:complete len:437 (+),score=79.66 TRINITY_DN23891_c0_g2_i1:77-1387(+)
MAAASFVQSSPCNGSPLLEQSSMLHRSYHSAIQLPLQESDASGFLSPRLTAAAATSVAACTVAAASKHKARRQRRRGAAHTEGRSAAVVMHQARQDEGGFDIMSQFQGAVAPSTGEASKREEKSAGSDMMAPLRDVQEKLDRVPGDLAAKFEKVASLPGQAVTSVSETAAAAQGSAGRMVSSLENLQRVPGELGGKLLNPFVELQKQASPRRAEPEASDGDSLAQPGKPQPSLEAMADNVRKIGEFPSEIGRKISEPFIRVGELAAKVAEPKEFQMPRNPIETASTQLGTAARGVASLPGEVVKKVTGPVEALGSAAQGVIRLPGEVAKKVAEPAGAATSVADTVGTTVTTVGGVVAAPVRIASSAGQSISNAKSAVDSVGTAVDRVGKAAQRVGDMGGAAVDGARAAVHGARAVGSLLGENAERFGMLHTEAHAR